MPPGSQMVVADASVLIALAKTGRIGLLRELYGEVAVGPRVKEEMIEGGREIQAPEVSVIEAAFQGKWMREVAPDASERRLSRRILTGSRLHEGEAEAIAFGLFSQAHGVAGRQRGPHCGAGNGSGVHGDRRNPAGGLSSPGAGLRRSGGRA